MKIRRGFVQIAILHLLREDSMHGYQIMKELEGRSSGLYRASAGTIYPALQDLLDEGMIGLENRDSEKKVYFINENGIQRLNEKRGKEGRDFWIEWKERQAWRNSQESVQLKKVINNWEIELHNTIKIMRKNPKDTIKLVKFIEETTEKLKKEFRQ